MLIQAIIARLGVYRPDLIRGLLILFLSRIVNVFPSLGAFYLSHLECLLTFGLMILKVYLYPNSLL